MFYFLAALLLSVIFTVITKKVALKLKIVDYPDNQRKQHKNKIALLGGTAIFLAFWLVVAYLILFTILIGKNIQIIQLIFIFIASLILLILGWFDDKFRLTPKLRLIISTIVICLVVLYAIDLYVITNPLGGIIDLNIWQFKLGLGGVLTIFGDIIVFFWLMGMLYVTKILDGLDGLATGVVTIGALMIFFLASTNRFYQADVRLISLILAGACLGFLFFNFYPAKIFLGEGGGLFLGFMLGVLAVVAGGKIATALLVMAVPILDLAWVVYKRLTDKQSIFKGDRRHLHYSLVDIGLNQRQVVLILYLISFLFGITTLILPSKFKLLVLIILAILFFIAEKKINLCLSKKSPQKNGTGTYY